MKKLIAALLAAAMAVGLTACGPKEGGPALVSSGDQSATLPTSETQTSSEEASDESSEPETETTSATTAATTVTTSATTVATTVTTAKATEAPTVAETEEPEPEDSNDADEDFVEEEFAETGGPIDDFEAWLASLGIEPSDELSAGD